MQTIKYIRTDGPMNFGKLKSQSANTTIDITEVIKQISQLKKPDEVDKFKKDIESIQKKFNKDPEIVSRIEKGFTSAFTYSNPDFNHSLGKMQDFVKNVPEVDLEIFDSIEFADKYKYLIAIESYLFDLDNKDAAKDYLPSGML